MQKMIESFIEITIRFRVIVLLVLMGLVGYSFCLLPKIAIDNSLEAWFVEGDPALEQYRLYQEKFGNDEVVSIVWNETNMSNLSNRDWMARMVMDLYKIDGVRKVYSPLDSNFSERLKGKDGNTVMALVEFEPMKNMDARRGPLLQAVRGAIDKNLPADHKPAYFAGLGVVYDALNSISLTDSSLFIALSYLLIFMLMAVFLRKPSFVLTGNVSVLGTLLIVMGLFSMMGKTINMVTMIIPSLILVYSVSDIIHMINTYRREAFRYQGEKKKTVIAKSLAPVIPACFLTSFTTAAGFASLATSKITVIRDLGVFGALGVMLEFFLALFFIPAILSFFHTPLPSESIHKPRFFSGIGHFLKFKKAILVFSLVFFVMMSLGIFRLESDTYSIGFLKENHPVRLDSDRIEQRFGYYFPLEWTVRGPEGQQITPEVVRAVLVFEAELEKQPDVEGVFSLFDSLPGVGHISDPQILSQVLGGIPADQIRVWISENPSMIRISSRAKMLSARGFQKIIDSVIPNAVFPAGWTVSPSGYVPLYVRIMEYMVQTQVWSFLTAFLIVFLIVCLYAGSVKLAIFAVLVNLFPIGITLGLMGYLGIRLDIATITIAAIALGIVVDDTIHFLHHYKQRKKFRESSVDAVRSTIRDIGASITQTSIVLILGFSVLLLANVSSVIYFGLLSVIVVFFAWIGDFFILPSLVVTFEEGACHEK